MLFTWRKHPVPFKVARLFSELRNECAGRARDISGDIAAGMSGKIEVDKYSVFIVWVAYLSPLFLIFIFSPAPSFIFASLSFLRIRLVSLTSVFFFFVRFPCHSFSLFSFLLPRLFHFSLALISSSSSISLHLLFSRSFSHQDRSELSSLNHRGIGGRG